MTRRALFLVGLGALLGTVPAATAAPAAGSTTARTGTWTTLPGSGVQVHATDASGRTTSVPVSWTADGTVTATWALPLTVTAPTTLAGQRVSMAAGYGLAVRRVGGAS